MAKYEYMVCNAKQDKDLRFIWKHPEELESFLNEKGKNGWKLLTERDMGGVWTLIFEKKIDG